MSPKPQVVSGCTGAFLWVTALPLCSMSLWPVYCRLCHFFLIFVSCACLLKLFSLYACPPLTPSSCCFVFSADLLNFFVRICHSCLAVRLSMRLIVFHSSFASVISRSSFFCCSVTL